MPIHCPVPTRLLSQEEFGALSYEVMADVFAIRNELGRFFDEAIYKQALAARRPDVELEVPVDISFKDFSKRYFLDALVARGRLFEFKAVERLSPRHKAQLLHGNCSGRFHALRQEGMAVESEPEVFEDGQAMFAEG